MLVPKDLTVYLDATDVEQHLLRLSYAAALAHRWQAHLIIAFSPEDLALNPRTGFARGAAIKNMYDAYDKREQQHEAELHTLISGVCGRFAVSFEVRVCKGEMGEPLMLHARHTAMAFLGASRRPDRQVSNLTLSEDVIFESGRPTVLVPADWPADKLPGKVVIGWNGSREAARAISDALPLIAGAEAVSVVVIPEQKIVRLLGQDPGADICRHLARYGVQVTLDRLQGEDAGKMLLMHANKLGADLLVMGAHGQPKISEFVFGSATQTLLANLEIPALLSR